MHTRVNAEQSVVNAGLSGVDDNVIQSDVCSMHATCMQGVDAGQSSVDARTPSVKVRSSITRIAYVKKRSLTNTTIVKRGAIYRLRLRRASRHRLTIIFTCAP